MARVPVDIIEMADSSTQDGPQLCVLLVEDNPVQQILVTHLLKQLGHAPCIASDGFEALSAVQRDRCYDVILMNCQMPLMDGFQATRFIREVESITGQQIAVIGISADASPDACFTAGMDDFLRKPLNKLLLKVALGRWIREKKGRRSRACLSQLHRSAISAAGCK